MLTEKKCVMCGAVGKYVDLKTEMVLCEKCANANEAINHSKEIRGRYKEI